MAALCMNQKPSRLFLFDLNCRNYSVKFYFYVVETQFACSNSARKGGVVEMWEDFRACLLVRRTSSSLNSRP